MYLVDAGESYEERAPTKSPSRGSQTSWYRNFARLTKNPLIKVSSFNSFLAEVLS
jgi:hypothetical protein